MVASFGWTIMRGRGAVVPYAIGVARTRCPACSPYTGRPALGYGVLPYAASGTRESRFGVLRPRPG